MVAAPVQQTDDAVEAEPSPVEDFNAPLPVSNEPVRSEIMAAIQANRVTIICGETG